MNVIFLKPPFRRWESKLVAIPNSKIMTFETLSLADSIIIPLSYQDMKCCISKFGKNNKIFVNDNFDVINMLDNKHLFIKFMIGNQLDSYIPKLYYSKFNSDIIDNTDKLTYPSIYKLPIGYGGKKSFVILNAGSYNSIKKDSNFIIQEYIQSHDEYSGYFSCT